MQPLEFITRRLQKLLRLFVNVNHQQDLNEIFGQIQLNQVEHPLEPPQQDNENNVDINELFWQIQLNQEPNRVEPPQMLIINDDLEPDNDDLIRRGIAINRPFMDTAPAA